MAVLTSGQTQVANSQIYAWPNPLTVNGVPPDEFTFANLPPNSVIKIYTLSGELIATRDSLWDAKNDDGRMVASGIYFFVVENEGRVKKTGKLAVIR